MIHTHSILVVDDEKQNRFLLTGLFKEDGYQVMLAKNGVQALERARAHLPDLILLDVLMPEMDGYQVIRELKADPATRDIPVIFISALDSADDEEKGLALARWTTSPNLSSFPLRVRVCATTSRCTLHATSCARKNSRWKKRPRCVTTSNASCTTT